MKSHYWKWSAALAIGLVIGGILTVTAVANWRELAATKTVGRPQVVVPVKHYEFGLMDPLSSGSYAFTVRNNGSAPLELSRGETTCKCTLSHLSTRVVPPGEQAQVKLEWNTGQNDREYEHSAVVYSNDPHQPNIRFKVSGRIRTQLGALPEAIVLGDVRPDESPTATTVIYSQIWRDLEIIAVESSLEDLQWTTEPVASAAAGDGAAGSVNLRVTLPSEMPVGHFSHWVRITVASTDQAGGPQSFELTLAGNRLGPLAVYGPAVDIQGVVDLGIMKPGRGNDVKLLVKVRDREPRLTITRTEQQPGFVEAHLRPYPGAAADSGLYELRIQVPADAPHCSYLHGSYGKLRFLIEHPRIQDLELDLRFAVLPHHDA